MTKPNLSLAMGLPPERAIEYFRSRGQRVSSDWRETADAVRAGAFSVAGVTRADVLQDIRDSMDRAITEGITYRDWLRDLEPKLAAKGWLGANVTHMNTGEITRKRGLKPWHLETVFRTNARAAYMAGRYKAMLENSDRRPYWRYSAVLDRRTRPRHRSLNGRIFKFNDPIWQVAFPPNGYNCRCDAIPLSEEDMESEGGVLSEGTGYMETIEVDRGPRGGRIAVTGYRDPQTGELFLPDPGFDHPPGDWGRDVALARRTQALKTRELRTQVWAQLNRGAPRAKAWQGFVSRVLDPQPRRPGNDGFVLGFVDEDAAEAARRLGDAEPTRVVVMTEKALAHADSVRHIEDGIALTRDQLAMLPGLIAAPDAVFWDTRHGTLVYVRWLADDTAVYVPVTAGRNEKRAGRIDHAVNAYTVPRSRLEEARFQRVK